MHSSTPREKVHHGCNHRSYPSGRITSGGLRDCREHRRNGSRPGRRSQNSARLVNCSRWDSATSASTAVGPLPILLAELVELGREAWRISERERAVRAEIEALREIEENAPWED